jgi:hypothetical protein
VDTTFLTIGLALALAALVGLTLLTGYVSTDEDGPFGSFVLGGTAIYGVFGAFLLLDPSQHLKGLNQMSSFAWLIALLLLMPVAFDEDYRTVKNGLLAATLGSMVGAIGTKAAEHYKPGSQQDLHTANIWLLIFSVLLAIAFLTITFRENNAKKRAAAQAKRDEASRYQAACAPGCTHGEPAAPVITDAKPGTSTIDMNKRL